MHDGIFPRLPFSRREAEAIYATAAPGDANKAVDFDASKATAVSVELGDYKIVHLATHGLVNSEHPALSGLVFSLIDREGQNEDGFLRLSDIYNLELNADLVVLSACQTALGKEIKGEGLIGITRGFMSAGSPRVMASLWKVDDEATAELMKKFYEGILRNGQRPAEALRAAQVWMLKQPRWEELADRTINRVAGELAEIVASYVGDPEPYFYAVADKIYVEYSRTASAQLRPLRQRLQKINLPAKRLS